MRPFDPFRPSARLARADPRTAVPETRALGALRELPGWRTHLRPPGELAFPPRHRPAPERKLLPSPLADIGLDGVFEGYASLFGVTDLGNDVIASGAFRDTLVRRGPAGVRMLWQHDPADPIGVWLSITEDGRGLKVRGRLAVETLRGREVHELLKRGAVDGLSIGFRAERARTDARSGVRRIEKLDLWEISIVTFPMLPGARVAAVKRAGYGLGLG